MHVAPEEKGAISSSASEEKGAISSSASEEKGAISSSASRSSATSRTTFDDYFRPL